MAGWRDTFPRGSYRERAGHILVDLAAGLPRLLHARPWRGMANQQGGNPAFDAQAAVFSHGRCVNKAWSKTGYGAG